ncbi:hypothetical protein E2C01_100971 [Portunus trituberculatus]|uniref:Uncharacterized protein n=1 Tax=Portunus trituberculatus TaxID=210409 RepID=A0A5B7KDJ4_PORTR|nr:hypothetical protein [Portunus trituberculatus]
MCLSNEGVHNGSVPRRTSNSRQGRFTYAFSSLGEVNSCTHRAATASDTATATTAITASASAVCLRRVVRFAVTINKRFTRNTSQE